MKAIYFCMILSICATAISSQSLSAYKTGCPNNNPFITLLKFVPNKYPTPKMGVQMCGTEWPTFGTCCDEWQLPAEVSEDKRILEEAVALYNTEIEKFKGVITKFYLYLKRFAMMPHKLWWTDFNNNIEKAHLILNRGSTLAFFNEFLSFDSIDIGRFKTANSQCWSEVLKARTSSLCFTCSGRSHLFFHANKAIVSENFCRQYMASCHYPLSVLVKFVKAMRSMKAIYEELEPLGLQLSISSKINYHLAARYWDLFASDMVPQMLDNYNPTTNPSNTIHLCDKFIKLRHTPFIVDIVQLISARGSDWTVHFWTYIEEHYNSNKALIDSKIAHWEALPKTISTTSSNWSFGRRLQSLQDFNSVIQSDVEVVANTDNSYSSFFGASGTSSNLATGLIFNMTMHYP